MTLQAVRKDRDNVAVTVTYGPVTFEVTETRGHALNFWHQLGSLVIEDLEDRAKAGYERYCASSGGKSFFSGDTLISWDDLPDPVRESWIAAFTE